MLTLCLSQSFQSQNWPGNELTSVAGENIIILCRISRENVVKSDVGAWFLILSVGDSILIQHKSRPLQISSTSSLGSTEREMITRLKYRLLLPWVISSTNTSDCACTFYRKPFSRVHFHWNRPVSYSNGWTGFSMKWRLMRANEFAFEKICPHQPPFHARSSPAVRIRKWSIVWQAILGPMLWSGFYSVSHCHGIDHF